MGTLSTIRSDATAMPEDSFLQDLTDLLTAGGVKNLGTDNHLKVIERGAGANMSVDVSVGRGFVKSGSANAYPVRHTGSVTNLAIASNSSGSGRKDTVVLYIDTAASPNSGATNVATLAVVQGTPSGSPVSPDDAAIQTAVGASNPFLRLADVTVGNGVSSILAANILDRRVTFKIAGFIDKPVIAGYFDNGNQSGTYNIDWSKGDRQRIRLTNNTTLTYSNALSGQFLTLEVVQDGTGGRTLTLPAGSTTPNSAGIGAIGVGANDENMISVYFNGTTYKTQLSADFG